MLLHFYIISQGQCVGANPSKRLIKGFFSHGHKPTASSNFVYLKWPKFLHGRNYGKVGRLTNKRNDHNNQPLLLLCKSIRRCSHNKTSACPMHMSTRITVHWKYNYMKYMANLFCLYIVDWHCYSVFVNLKGFLVVFLQWNSQVLEIRHPSS